MFKKVILLSSIICGLLQASDDISILKKELKEQQDTTKILYQKIEALSQEKSKSSASFSQTAYLPDIALILNMSAVSRDIKNSDYKNFSIPGFIAKGDAELPFNKNRGFNLNYAELAFHSAVDPYFDAFAFFHLHPDEFEIGEAYVTTRALPMGFRIKAGKFRSAFGRINEKHQHSWYFDDQPIIYKALFGPSAISDAGIQMQWVAPTDTYIMIGAEAMQGSNDRSFGYGEKNTLYTGYIKTSIDISDEISILCGISTAHGKTDENKDSDVYGVDFTLRDQLGSYKALSWQSEYLWREKANDKQAGFYSQLVYQHNKNFSGGVSYDRITKNDTDLSAYGAIDTDNLDKYGAMIEYKPFPFSRLRLSYSHDRTKIIAGKRDDINTIKLTLNIATGAHGAHSY